MLLSCCFRDPRNKKHKKRRSKEKFYRDGEDTTTPGHDDEGELLEIQAPSPLCEVYTVHSVTKRGPGQEKHPPSREKRKLLKQRSEESVRSIITPGEEILPSPPVYPLEVRHAKQGSVNRTSNSFHQNILEIRNNTPDSRLISPNGSPRNTSNKINDVPVTTSPVSTLDSNTFSSNQNKDEDQIHISGGFKKNINSHDVTLLHDWIVEEEKKRKEERRKAEEINKQQEKKKEEESKKNEEEIKLKILRENESKRVEQERKREEERKRAEEEKKRNEKRLLEEKFKEEELKRRLEAEYERKLEAIQKQHQAEIEEAEKRLREQLIMSQEHQRKELDSAVMKAKNEANRMISELNIQKVNERSKLEEEQRANSLQLEEEWRMKEERMNQWMVEVEERERGWQEERSEVLTEVQRLKEDAGRMVAILAKEIEEENFSGEKRLSLGQEVYSLRLVLEMRTGEVRSLRGKLAQAQHQLEDLEVTKSRLQNATTRLDDLQAQVAAKDKLEKQLSIEKSQLEMSVNTSNKAVERMSQDMEELQWRIRNNFDLPVIQQNCGRNNSDHARLELSNSIDSSHEIRSRPQSTPIQDRKQDTSPKKLSLFTVSQAMIEATTDQVSTPDYSPSSVTVTESIHKEAETNHYADSLGSDCNGDSTEDAETDSLDEGLGDISSETETVESPEPVEQKDDSKSLIQCHSRAETNTVMEFRSCPTKESSSDMIIEELQSSNKNPGRDFDICPNKMTLLTGPKISDCEDRIPSRITFDSPS